MKIFNPLLFIAACVFSLQSCSDAPPSKGDTPPTACECGKIAAASMQGQEVDQAIYAKCNEQGMKAMEEDNEAYSDEYAKCMLEAQ